ncbi:MAG: HrcA family transcriptional regulator, partial [Chloroflexota bacterium]
RYPELAPGSRVREVTEVLEDRQTMRSLLSEATEAEGVRVAIGRENRPENLHFFSIIFAQYGLPSEASGVVGIMGPTRLEYANAISSVRYLSSVMSKMLEMVQGKAAN